MKFADVRTYVKGVLSSSFTNKSTIDKLSESEDGTLLFDGNEIEGGSGDGLPEVYIGTTAPTDDNYTVWIDPTATDSESGGSGSSGGNSGDVYSTDIVYARVYNPYSIAGPIYSSSYRPVNFGGSPSKPVLSGGFFDGINITSAEQGSIFSTKKIDFSKYTKLIFEFEYAYGYNSDSTGRSLWIFAIDDVIDNYSREIDIALWASSRSNWSSLGGTVHEIDISSINDERYLAISCNFLQGNIINLRFE